MYRRGARFRMRIENRGRSQLRSRERFVAADLKSGYYSCAPGSRFPCRVVATHGPGDHWSSRILVRGMNCELAQATGALNMGTSAMAKHPRTWLVRAGKNAIFIDDFRANSVVAIGWRETGPIPPTADDDFLTELFDRTFATAKPG